MVCTMFFYNFQRGIVQQLRIGKQSIILVWDTLFLHNIHSIKYLVNILKIVYGRTDGQPFAIIWPLFKSGV